MKFKLYLGSTLLGTAGGLGLMYSLLSSENKLNHPDFYSELGVGTTALGLMGILCGLIAVKTYPIQLSESLSEVEKKRQMGWVCTLILGVAIVLNGIYVNIGHLLTFLDRDNFGISVWVLNFLIGFLLVRADDEFDEAVSARR